MGFKLSQFQTGSDSLPGQHWSCHLNVYYNSCWPLRRHPTWTNFLKSVSDGTFTMNGKERRERETDNCAKRRSRFVAGIVKSRREVAGRLERLLLRLGRGFLRLKYCYKLTLTVSYAWYKNWNNWRWPVSTDYCKYRARAVFRWLHYSKCAMSWNTQWKFSSTEES